MRHLGQTDSRPILAGAGEHGEIQSLIAFDDDTQTSFYVSVFPPGSGLSPRPRCGDDSGFFVVTCRRSKAGLIEVARGPARRSSGKTPLLIGRAFRRDGSSILLEIHAIGDVPFPQFLAERVLSDPLVGWQTTAGLNASGEALPDFHNLHYGSSLTSG
jgi:hypothetical protein